MQHVTIWTARRSYVGSIRLSNAASRVLCCDSEMLQIAHKWHWRYRGDHGGGGHRSGNRKRALSRTVWCFHRTAALNGRGAIEACLQHEGSKLSLLSVGSHKTAIAHCIAYILATMCVQYCLRLVCLWLEQACFLLQCCIFCPSGVLTPEGRDAHKCVNRFTLVIIFIVAIDYDTKATWSDKASWSVLYAANVVACEQSLTYLVSPLTFT